MTTGPTILHSPATRQPLWRRRWFWLVLVAIVAASGGGLWWWQHHVSVVEPPELDLHDADPAVAEAIEKERQHVLREPHSAAAWGKLAALFSVFNYRSEALVCCSQAERLDPRDLRWPYLQGVLLLLDNPNEAIPKLQRAVQLGDDTNLAPRLRLAEAYLSLHRLDEAEKEFRYLQEREPGNSRVQLGLGRIAMERQQWENAQTHLEAAALDRYSGRAAHIALMEIHQRKGEDKDVERLRQKLERLPPDVAWPDTYVEEVKRIPPVGKRFRLDRANRLFQDGNIQEAIVQYNQLVQDYPTSKEAWFSLGQALLRVGASDPRALAPAERAMQKVVDLAPGYAEAYNYLGAAQRRQGKFKEAIASLRTAIELKSDFAYAYANLGRCLTQQREYKDAIDAYRAAIRCKTDYVDAYIELAEVLHQTEQDREALEQVRLALQINPNDTRAKQLLEKLEPKKN